MVAMRRSRRNINRAAGVAVAALGLGIAAFVTVPAFAAGEEVTGSCSMAVYANANLDTLVREVDFASRPMHLGIGFAINDSDPGHGISSSGTVCGLSIGIARTATIVLCTVTSSINGDSVSAPRGVASRNCTTVTTDANGNASAEVNVPFVGDQANDTAVAMAAQATVID